MKYRYTNRQYLDALQQHTIIFDGAMGTSIQNLNLTARDYGGENLAGCIDHLVISHPSAVESVHRSFLEVGVDVIETCTFRSNRFTLREYGLERQVREHNMRAAALARKLADEYSRSGTPRFVAGSVGPSGKLPSINDPELSNVSFDDLAEIFCEQASGLLQGGVDLLLIETSQDILEVKAALAGFQQAFSDTGLSVPIQVQVTLDTTGRMLLGTDITAVLNILEGLPIEVLGLNCSTGPDYMREPVRFLGEQSLLPISCIPNAGLPLNVDGQAVYPMEPRPFADTLTEFVEKFGVNIVGGCCGTTPEHIRLLVNHLHTRPQPARSFFPVPQLSSSAQAVSMLQVPPPFLIGERLNTQGSQKFKQLMLVEDFDGAVRIARQQVENGAHGLDLCTALTERPDEAVLMKRLIKTLSPTMRAPFVIDSTELDVLEIALKTAPGRCLINSTNLESGRTKADRVLDLAKKYNAAVILLTIDEQGMAKTTARKLEIASRLYDIATVDHGLRPGDLVFDTLTFTLATGDPEFSRSAVETLDAIRSIKRELPGVLTSLGVSNLSFGLTPPARAVLNSVMLYHAVQAGLDMAIVNPAQITPYAELSTTEIELAENLIFNRNPEALQRLIEHFEKSGPVKSRVSEQQVALQSFSPEQRIHWKILHRQKDDIDYDIDQILQRSPRTEWSVVAVQILNTVLLPAMKEVGDKFGSGELILPFVLQSAEVMKTAVAHVEKFLERKEGVSKGLIVLATVYGDVHDIGKNLVKTILSNNGYQVIDLGKQVPAETIITKAVEINADAIGLSALLVSTSKQMPLIVNELNRRSLKFPVLIGGAAINRRFGRRILLTDQANFYAPGVFYCKDAFEGLNTLDSILDPQKKVVLRQQIQGEAEMELDRGPISASPKPVIQRSSISPAPNIPQVPGWGAHLVQHMPLEIVFKHLSKNDLFRLSWGAKNAHGPEWEKLQVDYENRLAAMCTQAVKEDWLNPQGIYGYWPAQSQDNELIIYDPASVQAGSPAVLQRFSFPRQPGGEYLCLADYFAGVETGRIDVAAFQIVTIGQQATDRFDHLQESGEYSEAYFTHGLAVQTAEASAEYLHLHIRRELGLLPNQGKRYSWGYPAIPELSDHARLFQLLPAEKELGMTLTSAFQLVPEQSTAAIILHHPQAKYYNVGETRIGQLMR